MDEDTGDTVPVERNELIFDKGTLITQDNLAKIRFYMAEGTVDEVEVSNQRRACFEMLNARFYPYVAQVTIGIKERRFCYTLRMWRMLSQSSRIMWN